MSTCPYCRSPDWTYEAGGDGSPEIAFDCMDWITIRRRCECKDCGRLFFMDTRYDEGEYPEEPLTAEEAGE